MFKNMKLIKVNLLNTAARVKLNYFQEVKSWPKLLNQNDRVSAIN